MGAARVPSRMRRVLPLVVLLVLAVPALVAPPAAAACEPDISLHSRGPPLYTSMQPEAGATAGLCLKVVGREVTDVRYVAPGATEVSVVFHRDFGEGRMQLTVLLDGLGFTNDAFTLQREADAFGDFAYRMPFVQIPGGPGASGTLQVMVLLPNNDASTKTYSTL